MVERRGGKPPLTYKSFESLMKVGFGHCSWAGTPCNPHVPCCEWRTAIRLRWGLTDSVAEAVWADVRHCLALNKITGPHVSGRNSQRTPSALSETFSSGHDMGFEICTSWDLWGTDSGAQEVGPPPAPAPDPPAQLPSPHAAAAAADTGIPGTAELGYSGEPTTCFKVGGDTSVKEFHRCS